jgi:hypothetical protein
MDVDAGSSLSLKLDGMGQMLCLLTAIAFLIFFPAGNRCINTKGE